MKTTILSLAIAALAMLGAAPQATAGSRYSNHVYISGYQSCGTPIYRERYFIGYDHCGRPIWGTRIVRHYARPVVRTRYVEPCPPVYHGRRDHGHDPRFEFKGSFDRW